MYNDVLYISGKNAVYGGIVDLYKKGPQDSDFVIIDTFSPGSGANRSNELNLVEDLYIDSSGIYVLTEYYLLKRNPL